MEEEPSEYLLDINTDNFLSTGLATLNVALTNNPYCGLQKGTYNFFVGDSDSGKTYELMCMLAEACDNPAFDDYTLVFDNAEQGMNMDVGSLFGTKVAERMQAPAYDEDDEEVPSVYVEEFYGRVKSYTNEGPVIYIMDSMDVLTTKAEEKKTKQILDDVEGGRDGAGSMSDGKAKLNSSNLRQLINPLRQTGSILIIIGQTRDNLGPGYANKTRSGGRALKFYAHTEIWTSNIKSLTKEVRGVRRPIGSDIRFDIKKNRTTGRKWKVDVPLITGYGFDDLSACIDFLRENQHWSPKTGKTFEAPEINNFKGSKEKLIRILEDDEDAQETLHDIVGEVWSDIITKLTGTRKKKYV